MTIPHAPSKMLDSSSALIYIRKYSLYKINFMGDNYLNWFGSFNEAEENVTTGFHIKPSSVYFCQVYTELPIKFICRRHSGLLRLLANLTEN